MEIGFGVCSCDVPWSNRFVNCSDKSTQWLTNHPRKQRCTKSGLEGFKSEVRLKSWLWTSKFQAWLADFKIWSPACTSGGKWKIFSRKSLDHFPLHNRTNISVPEIGWWWDAKSEEDNEDGEVIYHRGGSIKAPPQESWSFAIFPTVTATWCNCKIISF